MTRSFIAAALLVCLAVSTAAAQSNVYWEAIPPQFTAEGAKLKAAEIPNVPFAGAPNVRVAGEVSIARAFKLLGLWAPLWLGPNMVALPGTLNKQVTLMAWYGERFNRSRVVADSSTVHGAGILDMAVSRDGKRLAIAATTGDKLQIWQRDTQSDAPASLAATIDGACDKAGLAWLNQDTVAVGVQFKQNPAPAPVPSESPIVIPGQQEQPAGPQIQRALYIVQLAGGRPPANIDLDCLKHVEPWTLTWSPDSRYALGLSEEQPGWTVIDRVKPACETITVPGIVPAGFIEWGGDSTRFLFTATPTRWPDPAHVGVMEYRLTSHKGRLLASPATAASYVGGARIAVLGSQRLNAAAIAANPDKFFPAEIAWIDPGQSELNIVPTGLSSTAADLLRAHLRFSAANGLVALSFETANPKTTFAVLMWLAAAGNSGGVLGTGRMGTMLMSWSPDGAKLAVLAGLPDHPTLEIVAAPR
jgi:Lipoprotein LpqB beta-propeller domain